MFVQLHLQPANQVQCTYIHRFRLGIPIGIRMGGYWLFLLLPLRATAFYRFNNKRTSASRWTLQKPALALGGDVWPGLEMGAFRWQRNRCY